MHATGTMIGLAIGDALGFPTEFDDISSIMAKCGPWRGMKLPAPAFVTDDTQMTIAVGRGLRDALRGTALDPAELADAVRAEFVVWLDSPDNNRAPGNTCLAACRDLARPGTRWQEASRKDSKGCGANMRVAPVGLVPGLDEEQRAGAAQLQSGLTHGHPTALAAGDLTAHAVHLLERGALPGELVNGLRVYALANRTRYHERWLGDLWRGTHDASPESYIARGWDECLDALDRLDRALAAADPEVDPCRVTGAGWIAEEALATGLLCFLLFPEDPVTAVRRAACSSGDSDSIACLTGAFAGAYLGASAWPQEWGERIEYLEELLALGALWDEGTP